MANNEFANEPVLLTPRDLTGLDPDYRHVDKFVPAGVRPLLDAKRAAREDAITEAVHHLLTHSAVALVHVNTDRRQTLGPIDRPELQETYFETDEDYPIGFTDHGGGSSSDFRILLNGAPADRDASYVLYSPPAADGSPTNLTFRRASHGSETYSLGQRYRTYGYVPAPLKTDGVIDRAGELDYKYYLFGGDEVPGLVYDRFAAAGFDFSPEPYTLGQMAELSGHGARATPVLKSGFRGNVFWPGDQFHAQLRQLGRDVDISPEAYPLARN